MECQTNDAFWSALVFEQAQQIKATYILFGDAEPKQLNIEHAHVRKLRPDDKVFSKDPGEYVLLLEKKIVATGGFLLHYNKPFADLYMEVKPTHRRRGLGSYLIQELRQLCTAAGRMPAARCRVDNVASKATLLKGGLKIAGYLLEGVLK